MAKRSLSPLDERSYKRQDGRASPWPRRRSRSREQPTGLRYETRRETYDARYDTRRTQSYHSAERGRSGREKAVRRIESGSGSDTPLTDQSNEPQNRVDTLAGPLSASTEITQTYPAREAPMTRIAVSQSQPIDAHISTLLINLITSVSEEMFTRIKHLTAKESHALCMQRSHNSATRNFPRFVEQNRAGLVEAELEASHWEKELQSKTMTRETETQILLESFVASQSRSQQDEQRETKLMIELAQVKARIDLKDRAYADMKIENGALRGEVRKLQEWRQELELKFQQLNERLLKNDNVVSSNNEIVVNSLSKITAELEDVSDMAVKASGHSEASLERINELLSCRRQSITPENTIVQLREDIARHETSFLTDIYGESGLLIRVADHDDKFDVIEQKCHALQHRVEVTEPQLRGFEKVVKEFELELQSKDEEIGAEFKYMRELISSLVTEPRTTVETIQTPRDDFNLATLKALEGGYEETNRRIEALEISQRQFTIAFKEITGQRMQLEQRPLTPPLIQAPLTNGVGHDTKDFGSDIEQLRDIVRFLEDRYSNLTTEQVVRCMLDQLNKLYPLDAERENNRRLMQQINIIHEDNLTYRKLAGGQLSALSSNLDSMQESVKQALNIAEMSDSCVKEAQQTLDELSKASAETRGIVDMLSTTFKDASQRTDELEKNLTRFTSTSLTKFSEQVDNHGKWLEQHDKYLSAGRDQLCRVQRSLQGSRGMASTPPAASSPDASTSFDNAGNIADALETSPISEKRKRRESRKATEAAEATEAAAAARKPASNSMKYIKSEREPLPKEPARPKHKYLVDLTGD